MFSNGNDEERVIHSKSDNIEMMINDKEDEVIENFFSSSFKISKCVGNINERQWFHIWLCLITVLEMS